jgi:hypothetical protein
VAASRALRRGQLIAQASTACAADVSSGGERGDRFGPPPLLALVGGAGFRPRLWAAECDLRAEWAESHGLRFTPLGLAELARHLDPSRPDYALRAARLNESLGRQAAAETIERNLGSSWSLYLVDGGRFRGIAPRLPTWPSVRCRQLGPPIPAAPCRSPLAPSCRNPPSLPGKLAQISSGHQVKPKAKPKAKVV